MTFSGFRSRWAMLATLAPLAACQGAEGPPGDPGPPGERGPAGSPGAEPILSVYAISVTDHETAEAWCDDADLPLGGSCVAASNVGLDSHPHVVDEAVVGWACWKDNLDVTAHVVCLAVE